MAKMPPSHDVENSHVATDPDIGGIGGIPILPGDDPNDGREFSPSGGETPPSAYRMMTLLAILWSSFLFATITLALEWRWAHSADRVAIALPGLLFKSTALLLAGSALFELARRALRIAGGKACAYWLALAGLLAVTFVACVLTACRELAARGPEVTSTPGAFFFYLLTGAYTVHLLIGIASLVAVARFVYRPSQRVARENAVNVMGLYWHFMSGLWLCLLALLFVTIQR